MEYKSKAIECARYSIEEYTDYCEKLVVGILLYSDVKDDRSAERCKKELVDLADKLESVKAETNPLAWKIQDKPELELSDEYMKMIEEYEQSEE